MLVWLDNDSGIGVGYAPLDEQWAINGGPVMDKATTSRNRVYAMHLVSVKATPNSKKLG